jgi:chemotaxis protein CheD
MAASIPVPRPPEPERERYTEYYLQPGDFQFGEHRTRLHTLLGSCIAITMWHPYLQIGGMCHYMLPGEHPDPDAGHLDGRYAGDAVEMFLRHMRAAQTHPREWVAKMFGGGSQFPDWTPAAGNGLPERNIEAGLDLLDKRGIPVTATHFGGTGHRQVVFDVWTGDVWLKHVDASEQVGGPR